MSTLLVARTMARAKYLRDELGLSHDVETLAVAPGLRLSAIRGKHFDVVLVDDTVSLDAYQRQELSEASSDIGGTLYRLEQQDWHEVARVAVEYVTGERTPGLTEQIAGLVKQTVFDRPDGTATPETGDGLGTKIAQALLARYEVTPR